jgi:hypothetical protein
LLDKVVPETHHEITGHSKIRQLSVQFLDFQQGTGFLGQKLVNDQLDSCLFFRLERPGHLYTVEIHSQNSTESCRTECFLVFFAIRRQWDIQ